MRKYSHITSFLSNYVLPLILIFSALMALLHFILNDYQGIGSILQLLIAATITVLVLLIGIVFVIIQFTAQRYSPRILRRVVLNSPDTIFIVTLYISNVLFGIVVLGNSSAASSEIVVNAFISFSLSIFILSLFFLNRLTSSIRPDLITSKLRNWIQRESDSFLSNLARHYRNDPVRYPLNIPAEDDEMVPLFNILEGSMTSHDLASINITLRTVEEFLDHCFSNESMTADEAVALTQYIGMHLTRTSEMVPDVHEDDIYQDIFRILNLLAIGNSNDKFLEAYKWCMITYYYILKFIERGEKESDYPIRTAIAYVGRLVENKAVYNERRLPLFLDLLNFLSCIDIDQEIVGFKEPMEQWLMGMESVKLEVVSLHTKVCEQIALVQDPLLVRVYLQKVLERLVLFETFALKEHMDDTIKKVLSGLDDEKRSTITRELEQRISEEYTIHADQVNSVKDLLARVSSNQGYIA